MKKIIFILVIINILVIGFFITQKKVKEAIYTPLKLNKVLCAIRTGDSGRKIAENLSKHHIIKNRIIFHLLIRHKGVDTKLKAGYYLFDGEFSMIDVIEKIVSGEILVARVTIPEGFSMYRTFKAISDEGVGDYDRFLELAGDSLFIKEVTGFDVSSIEGFLYPDTYTFGMFMSEESVIKTMVKNLYDRLREAHLYIYDAQQFYEQMILASIVEKEAVFNDEKPLIAGVYLHRLKKGMRLQADPTVTYHLEPEFIHKNRVTYNMTREETPYNTYVITGLPPKPICSPAVSTLYAVVFPEETGYLFFFADKTRSGRHIFTQTYTEHLEKQRQNRLAN